EGGADAERERGREAALDLVDDVLPVLERREHGVLAVVSRSEAGDGFLHHLRVLHIERLVEAPLLADVRDVGREGVLARHSLGRVAARDEDEHDEDEQADHEQDGDHPEQPADDEGGQCSILTFARGSRASRRPSPKMFSESTVSTIARPGISASHGAVWSWSWPSAIRFPHDGSGGRTPAPRNERP